MSASRPTTAERIAELEARITRLERIVVSQMESVKPPVAGYAKTFKPSSTVNVTCGKIGCSTKQEVARSEAPGWRCSEHSVAAAIEAAVG